jgi:steroid delta-isomerase-like uncharacterized protein
MSSEDNKRLAHRYFEEFCNGRKLDIADELFSHDHQFHDPSIPEVSPGPEGMKQTIAVYQLGFPDVHWQINEMLATEDTVITRWTGSGTQTNELAGNPPIPPTGKKASVEGIMINRIAGGKIVESWEVWDTLGMLRQLGVIPTPAATS